jgi:hypothetical protein
MKTEVFLRISHVHTRISISDKEPSLEYRTDGKADDAVYILFDHVSMRPEPAKPDNSRFN